MVNLEDIVDGMNLENAITIDINEIDERSTRGASDFVNKISGLFCDEGFFDKHPRLKKRISIEVESLRSLLKMRNASEQAHDALLNAISSNNSNATFYRALSDTQRSSLAITTKIEECVERIEELIKDASPERNHESSTYEEEEDDNIHRGSKDFIKDMLGSEEE